MKYATTSTASTSVLDVCSSTARYLATRLTRKQLAKSPKLLKNLLKPTLNPAKTVPPQPKTREPNGPFSRRKSATQCRKNNWSGCGKTKKCRPCCKTKLVFSIFPVYRCKIHISNTQNSIFIFTVYIKLTCTF